MYIKCHKFIFSERSFPHIYNSAGSFYMHLQLWSHDHGPQGKVLILPGGRGLFFKPAHAHLNKHAANPIAALYVE